MVRLKVRVDRSLVEEYFQGLMDKYVEVEYWQDNRFNKYRFNWKIIQRSIFDTGEMEGSFWVGYRNNMEKASERYNMVVEYNPNKVNQYYGLLKQILEDFFRMKDFEVVSCDLACDMPININKIIVGKEGKSIKKTFDYGGDNKTYYLGEGDGRIKIYNKAREMKLEGVDITRYEISKEIKCPISLVSMVTSLDLNIVGIYCLDSYQYSMDINDTEKALVYAVLNGYPVEELSRRKAEKVKKILSECAGYTIESTGFDKAFHKYFKELKDWLLQVKTK